MLRVVRSKHPDVPFVLGNKEANFHKDDVEYRLGAACYSLRDDVGAVRRAGFGGVAVREDRGDDRLADRVPAARWYVGFPILAVLEAHP